MLVCAYPDNSATADAVRRVHPSLVDESITPSPDHLPAEQFLASYPLPPPIELGKPDLTDIIDDPAELATLRRHRPACARVRVLLSGLRLLSGLTLRMCLHSLPPSTLRYTR
jgi:hypothetical protein